MVAAFKKGGDMAAMQKVFDGHNDFLLRLMKNVDQRKSVWLEQNDKGHLDLPRMRAGGFAGGLFAIFVPPKTDGPPPDFMELMKETPYDLALPPLMTHDAAQATALTQAGLMHWMVRMAPNDFGLCLTAAEVSATMAAGKIAGVLHMEGAEAIGPDLDALYLFHAMGLRSLGPVWSRPTIFGTGVPFRFPGDPDIGPGLTDLGKDLVRLCNQLRIMVDLSHLNAKGFDDVAEISDAPLVATHSNAHAISESARNLTDDQLDVIRASGGMVGLNFATFFLRPDGRGRTDVGWDVVLSHLDHLIDRLGEDHVGFGSDFDGCILPAEIGDVQGLPALQEAMRTHGYSESRIAKISHANWVGVLERTWGA
ncbi:MAG: dipeptidase [Pseudomonadota bacterium]